MKKILSVITAAIMVISLSTVTVFANPGNGNGVGHGFGKPDDFKDMKGHWGFHSAQKVQSYGIFGGYSDGTFQPDKTITQAELAVILDRLLEIRQGKDADDQSLNWYGGYSFDGPAWAKTSVLKGFNKHYFNMNEFHAQVQVDRLTACVALAKALDLEPVTDFANNPFKDRGTISDEDYGYLLALYKEGYVNGYPNGCFYPYNSLSRVQLACIIEKLLDELEAQNDTSDDDNAPSWDRHSAVTATAIRVDSVELEWTAADDDVKVTGYKVLYEIDGYDKVKYLTGRIITISGLEEDEDYTFTVEARDAAGNWSDDGPSVDVITLGEDTEDPTWPGGAELTISAPDPGILTIIWPDAKDNDKITAYKLYQDGQLLRTLNGEDNSASVSGLKADTKYTFKVKAEDAAGNLSVSLSKTYRTE